VDPRPENHILRGRHEFWTLGNLLREKFGDEWDCRLLDTSPRQHAVGDYTILRSCTKMDGDLRFTVEQRYLQAEGQTSLTPHQTHRPEGLLVRRGSTCLILRGGGSGHASGCRGPAGPTPGSLDQKWLFGRQTTEQLSVFLSVRQRISRVSRRNSH
jgi:hypothetical protein